MVLFNKIKGWLLIFGIILILLFSADITLGQVSGVSVVSDLTFGNVLG